MYGFSAVRLGQVVFCVVCVKHRKNREQIRSDYPAAIKCCCSAFRVFPTWFAGPDAYQKLEGGLQKSPFAIWGVIQPISESDLLNFHHLRTWHTENTRTYLKAWYYGVTSSMFWWLSRFQQLLSCLQEGLATFPLA